MSGQAARKTKRADLMRELVRDMAATDRALQALHG